MATLTITVPDDKVDRVLTGVCGSFGYAGPGTQAAKRAFVEGVLKKFLRDATLNYEARQAAEAAHAAHLAAAGGSLDLS